LDWLTNVLAPAEFHDAIALLDAGGKILFANPAGQAALTLLYRSGSKSERRPLSIPNWFIEQCARAGIGEGLSVILDSCTGPDRAVRAVRVPDKCGGGYLLHMSRRHPQHVLDDELTTRRLSHREIDVTRIAAKGLSTKQIANEMSLSRFTIQDHLKSIYRKLGVNNRAGLMRFVLGFN
jgi:DNA-binding CsgD family transcriptional regulator